MQVNSLGQQSMLKFLCQCALVVCLPFSAVAHGATVLFLNPGHADETFWVSYSQFMQAAAKNLHLQLQIRYADRSAPTAVAQAREALKGEVRPDYLVFVNEEYIAPQILRMAKDSGVKLFMVNNALTPEQLSLVGPELERDPYWIGSMVANDEEAGYLMLSEIIRQHGPVSAGQSVDLLAFSGPKNTPAAQLREKGLYRALAEHPEVRLRQRVYGEWNKNRAYDQATLLLKRYPATALIWSANDEMAFGAMQAAQEAGKVVGRDVLFSAVNSSIPALEARIDGRLSALVGGHFTLGGWAMVLIGDDAKGIEISQFGGRNRKVPLLQLIDRQQAQHLLVQVRSETWQVPFARLSAQGKPASWHYPFSLNTVLQAP